jgi:ribosomal protein S18 acetylase RimI-like enzyme
MREIMDVIRSEDISDEELLRREQNHWAKFYRKLPGIEPDGADSIVHKMTDGDGRTWYRVYRNGHQVASARLSHDGSFVQDVNVDKELQRRGIARALYAYIETDLGHALKPSPLGQTAAGQALWRSRQR